MKQLRTALDSLNAFRASLGIQRRVIGALLMREVITRFGRENLGVLWLAGEPMLFTIGVATLWTMAGMHHGSSLPIIAFAITGYSSVLLWRNTVNRSVGAIQGNRNLLYHRNVRLIDVFVTRVLLEVAGATASFTLLSVLFFSLEWIDVPSDMLKVVGGWLMLGWFGAALALVIGSATAYSEVVDRIWHPLSYITFPLSGAAFMVSWLPAQGQEFVLLLPMVHGVELLRDGYFGNAVKPIYDLSYMATCNAVLTLLGLVLLRDASRRVDK